MSVGAAAYHTHLDQHVTTVATVWGITRKDGLRLGFTDHDRDLSFAGLTYVTISGLWASSLSQNTGLSVDNTEAMGVLTHDMIAPEDIDAGLYDAAEVEVWRVNWQDTDARQMIFKGYFGEITRDGASFRVELRGLTEVLQLGGGAVYGRSCSANFGDDKCRALSGKVDRTVTMTLAEASDVSTVSLGTDLGHAEGWFTHGTIEVLSGAAQGVTRRIRNDVSVGGTRQITLWEPLAQILPEGTEIKLIPGCDRSFATCRDKFQNTVNYRGFPHLPTEDWLTAGVGSDL